MNFKFKEGEKVKVNCVLSKYHNFIGTVEYALLNPISNSNKYVLRIGETILREVIDEKYLQLYELEG